MMMPEIESALAELRGANPGFTGSSAEERGHRLGKVLVANRGEIAKRFFFALREEGILSVAVVTDPDRKQSWYEFADEVVYIGEASNYTSIPVLLGAAMLSRANAIYPGYGFLSENYRFVEAIDQLRADEGFDLIFMGPSAAAMRRIGHKLDARALAKAHGVPVLEGSGLIANIEDALREGERIGYPVMVKLSAGGGGKGMAVAWSPTELPRICESARRIGHSNYGDDSLFLERYVERPVHLEVQIFNGMAVGIRKCAVQRKSQKIIEESGDVFLDGGNVLELLAAAENVAALAGYADLCGAGTVEFLFDADTGEFGFLEVNTRLQVEYPVTDQSLHIDLVKWQILLFDGREHDIPYERARRLRFAEKDHAIECRIYAEDPWNDYAPSPGVIRDLDLPTFNGVRCDVGFKAGDRILPNYDPMIGKIIAFGRNRHEARVRLERALGEIYVRGITTNVDQLLKIVRHPSFRTGDYTNRMLADGPDPTAPVTDVSRSVEAAVFAALAEFTHSIHRTLELALASGDLENILQRGVILAQAPAFYAEVLGLRLRVDFVQHRLETYAAYVNRTYVGEFVVSQRVRGSGDYTILFRGRSYPVRVDRRPAFHVLRIMECDGTHYYRVGVRAIDAPKAVDAPGTVRSPFQGAFVKWALAADGSPLGIGTRVERGDALITIEAMKMESTLRAPVSGRVSYMVEDGAPERLVRGTTAQGLVLGKPLAEGEVLVVVEGEGPGRAPTFACDPVPICTESHVVFARLQELDLPDGGMAEALQRDPTGATRGFLDLVHGYVLGYLLGDDVPRRLECGMETLRTADVALGDAEATIAGILATYSALKQIYSSAMGGDQTWFGEMNRLVREWENESYSPPAPFRSVLRSLRKQYGIPGMEGKRSPEMRMALFHLLRGYSSVRGGRALIIGLLDALLAHSFRPRVSRAALVGLVQIEQSERDDSIAVMARALLTRSAEGGRSSGSPPPARRTRLAGGSTVATDVAKGRASGNPDSPGRDVGDVHAGVRAALANPGSVATVSSEPEWVRVELAMHVARWERRFRTERLPSPAPTVVQFRLVPHAGSGHRYATIAWLEEGVPIFEADSRGRVRTAPNVERAAVQAGRILDAYNDVAPGDHNIVEILACARPIDLDLASDDPGVLNYESLVRIAARPMKFFLHTRVDFVLVHLDARRPGATDSSRKVFNVHLRHGRACLDVMHETDARNPLWNGTSDALDQRLFDQGKWPLECWVSECFDAGTHREIRFESIDGSVADLRAPEAGAAARPAVGAKLFAGLLDGRPAVFYCKDSRISGGATGDREGRKYAAACYYAYLRDVPLYVFNDGAGANVRQGMVALNRAAEGFMLNALTGHGVSRERFLTTTRAVADPVLRDLFAEIDRTYGLPAPPPGGIPRDFMIVAVGVGSATGLDVYGSSQATVQIMLDAESSYRVLTGSGVIRAVTGESLSNYEIGGARVMAHWTGTVDLVARDRVELVRHVRRIRTLFGTVSHRSTIDRAGNGACAPSDDYADSVLSEGRVAANVDAGTFVPFKGEYVDAAALVAGFARLGGKHVLIMGPRTDFGVRSYACLVRSRELLRIAAKTRSPQILVFGDRWFRAVEGEDHTATRAQTELVRQLFRPGPPRIHIVTRPEGMLRVTLNALADATIYVKRAQDTERDRRIAVKNATFHADSLAEAFDIANRILGFFAAGLVPMAFAEPRRSPRVPDAAAQPFDMVADVVTAIVDEGSFLEFDGGSEERSGSTLVTGLATLEGQVVGIIGDQPAGGGAPDAPGTEKFRVFMEFLERNRFPLVMLSNAPGFVPGTKQERLRIQQIGGESLDVNVLSTIPVVSVTLNQNFGGRQIHAFSRFLRPGVVCIALERATLAVMGGSAAFDLFHGARFRELSENGRHDEADRMREEFLDAFNRNARADQDAAATGALDWTFSTPDDLRRNIVRAMRVAQATVSEMMLRQH